MASSFEQAARRADQLPVENWRQRRIDALRSHGPSIQTLRLTLGRLAKVVLDGRISTDITWTTEHEVSGAQPGLITPNLDTTDPDKDIAYALALVTPTGALRRWEERHLDFTPDNALGVSIRLEDRYEWPRSMAGDAKSQPTGDLELELYARSWGKLTPEETEAIGAISGAWAEYGDNGFSRNGSRAVIRRGPGEVVTTHEAETFLAPFAGHILNYFEIMGFKNPGDRQSPGNFSDRSTPVYVAPPRATQVFPERLGR